MQIIPSRKKRKKNGKTNLKTTREIIKKTVAIKKRVKAFLTFSAILDFSFMKTLFLSPGIFSDVISQEATHKNLPR
jgi:hypothetical protein